VTLKDGAPIGPVFFFSSKSSGFVWRKPDSLLETGFAGESG